MQPVLRTEKMLFLRAQNLPQQVLRVRIVCEPVTVLVGTEKDPTTHHPSVHVTYFMYIVTSHPALPGCGYTPSTDEKLGIRKGQAIVQGHGW